MGTRLGLSASVSPLVRCQPPPLLEAWCPQPESGRQLVPQEMKGILPVNDNNYKN